MPPPSQSSQPQGDNSLSALWLSLFFFLIVGAIWHFFHTQIAWFLLKIKYFEACFISIFNESVLSHVQLLDVGDANNVSIDSLMAVMKNIGNYVRYPVVLLLLIFAGVLFFSHPTTRYKKTHDMQSLYEQEKFNWQQIMPIANINLTKEPIEKGPWGMSLTPMQFAKKHRLLIEQQETSLKLGEQQGRISVLLNHAAAYQVFSLQLGQAFNGIDKLNMHTKALFAVFASRANRDQETAKKILDQMAVSALEGNLNFTGINNAVDKYKPSSVVKTVVQKHAYVLTFMASMLEAARQDGVLASADFLWLKVVDRPLWYMLNNVGRQTAYAEVGGAFAHWIAEKRLGRKISMPMVDEAVKALDIALKEVIYVPDQ